MHLRNIKINDMLISCRNNCNVCDSLYVLAKILLIKTKKNEFYLYNDYQIKFFHVIFSCEIVVFDNLGTCAIGSPAIVSAISTPNLVEFTDNINICIIQP